MEPQDAVRTKGENRSSRILRAARNTHHVIIFKQQPKIKKPITICFTETCRVGEFLKSLRFFYVIKLNRGS